jgi:hypothetical protein
MPHGGYHGTIVMNDKIVQQGKKDDQGIYQIQGGIDEPSQLNIPYNPTVTSPSNQNIDKDKLTKPTGILAPLYGGSTGSIEGYNPENYDVAGQHPLSEQFVRLADKYYGGDQEAFAQTSQGQVLLNYLQDVPANKGGLMGLENPDILEKAIDQTSLFDEELTMDKDKDDQPVKSDIVNLIKNSAAVRERLTSPQYVQYLQMLQNRYPDIYSEVRPVQSGKALTELFKKVIPSYITGPLSNLLPQEKPAFFEPENAPLGLELLPLIQSPDTDQGGMNDVAQAVINQNETPVIDPVLDPSIIAQLLEENLPEGGINTFDPNSFAFT